MNPNETMVLVIVVPTLAPIMMGVAFCKVIDPDATRATTKDVVVELLWSIAVMRRPINNPVNGLAVAIRIVSATFLPICCRDEVIKSNANRKSTNAKRM